MTIIGVYPQPMGHFLVGQVMNKNLTVQIGNCNHRRYISRLFDMVVSGMVDPTKIITRDKPMQARLEVFEAFDWRETGWIKVELEPEAAATE